MQERTSYLFALAKAVAARETEQFAELIKAAYQTGATREDLLTAVEIGRVIGEPSRPVMAEAYATIHAWQWIASRGLVGAVGVREIRDRGDHD